MIRAVVFDLYDTLIYRDESVTARDRARIAVVLGLSPARLASFSRRHRDERMLGAIPTIENLYELAAKGAGLEPSPQMVAEAARLERASLRESVGVYAGTIPVLRPKNPHWSRYVANGVPATSTTSSPPFSSFSAPG